MKQGYKFLTKHLPIILCCSLATAAIGVTAMKLGYNPATSWLKLSGVCTILFALAFAFLVGYAIFVSVKMPDIHLARIKKKCAFLKIASVVSFIMIFFMFCLETHKIILASYQEKLPEYFTIWRILKYICAFPASVHFLLMAIPSKINRKKRIKIPKAISYITSVGAILWAIFGLLSAYFYSQMTIRNVLKIWQLVVYLAFILYFLFEAKFDHLNNGKKVQRGFIFTGCFAYILACAFSLTTTICMIFRIIPLNPIISFSATEVLTSFTVGLYAFSKLYAYLRTVKVVINNSDSDSSRKSHHSHHSDSNVVSANENAVDNDANNDNK